MYLKILLLTLLTFLSACNDEDKEYIDNLSTQSEISSKEGVKAETEELNRRSEEIETYLMERKRFISAIVGEYSGEIFIDETLFLINLEIISSMPIEFHRRIRTLDEVNFEVENLALNMMIKLEASQLEGSAVTCHIIDFRPDTNSGILNIINERCNNIFKFFLSDSLEIEKEEWRKHASLLVDDVRNGNQIHVDYLNGVFRPAISTQKYYFQLTKRSGEDVL